LPWSLSAISIAVWRRWKRGGILPAFFILGCPFFDHGMNHHTDVNAFIPKWFGRRRGVIHHASFCRMPGAQ